MSLFGAAPNKGPSIFGTTAGLPPSSGGLFANSTTQPQQQQQQQQQPGITPQAPAGGGLFGSTSGTGTGSNLLGSQQQQQQQQQPQQQQSGLFGSSATQTGGLFGQPATQQQQPQQQQQQQQQQQSGGLFGNAPQPSGGLFGSTANPSGGGLFGVKPLTAPAQPNPALGGSLFSQSQQPQQQQQSGGLFGASQPQPQQPSGGLFGAKPTQTQPTGLFGSLGATQPQVQPQAGTSLFGASSLGQPAATTNAPGPSILGASSSMGTSMLGTSILGKNTLGLPMMNQTTTLRPTSSLLRPDHDPQTQHARYLQKISDLYASWNPQSPDCRFQHYFYNLVHPDDAGRYGRPAGAVNDAMWEKAVKENPDPTCLTPAPANSFDDLRIRVEAQSELATMHQGTLTDLTTRLKALNERHTLSNTSRLQRAVAQHQRLTHRLLNFVQHLHLLLPTVRSSPIRPEEEQLRAKLEEIEDEVRHGRFRGKLNELWAIISTIHAARERERGRMNFGDGEWRVVDEDGLAQLSAALNQQQTAIQYLLKTTKQQHRDVGVILGSGPSDISDVDVLYNLPSMMQPNVR